MAKGLEDMSTEWFENKNIEWTFQQDLKWCPLIYVYADSVLAARLQELQLAYQINEDGFNVMQKTIEGLEQKVAMQKDKLVNFPQPPVAKVENSLEVPPPDPRAELLQFLQACEAERQEAFQEMTKKWLESKIKTEEWKKLASECFQKVTQARLEKLS